MLILLATHAPRRIPCSEPWNFFFFSLFLSLVSIESKDHKSFGSTFSAASLDCMYVGIAQGRQAPIINKIKIFTIVEETVYCTYMYVRTRICRPIQHQHAIPAHLRYTYIDCACIVLFEKKKGILIDPEAGTAKSIFLAKFSTTSNYSYTSHDLHGQQRSGPQPKYLCGWPVCGQSSATSMMARKLVHRFYLTSFFLSRLRLLRTK